MKEIDETLMNIANEHSNRMTEEEKQAIIERFYQKSIQDEKHSKSQKIAGELYVGRTSKFQNYVKGAVIRLTTVGVIAGIAFVGNKAETLSSYNNQLNLEAKTELNADQQEMFDKNRDGILNVVNNVVTDLDKINENKDELKETGNYTLLGKNIDNPRPISKGEADGLFPLSDLTKDAIDKTVNQTVDEYKSR